MAVARFGGEVHFPPPVREHLLVSPFEIPRAGRLLRRCEGDPGLFEDGFDLPHQIRRRSPDFLDLFPADDGFDQRAEFLRFLFKRGEFPVPVPDAEAVILLVQHREGVFQADHRPRAPPADFGKGPGERGHHKAMLRVPEKSLRFGKILFPERGGQVCAGFGADLFQPVLGFLPRGPDDGGIEELGDVGMLVFRHAPEPLPRHAPKVVGRFRVFLHKGLGQTGPRFPVHDDQEVQIRPGVKFPRREGAVDRHKIEGARTVPLRFCDHRPDDLFVPLLPGFGELIRLSHDPLTPGSRRSPPSGGRSRRSRSRCNRWRRTGVRPW